MSQAELKRRFKKESAAFEASGKKFVSSEVKVGKEAFEAQEREFEAKKKIEPVVSPTIQLQPKKKTGIAALVEQPTIAGKVAKVLTSPKTTVILGATLATVLTMGATAGGGLAAAGTRGAITLSRSTTGAIVGKVATNPKTIALTTSILSKFFTAKTLAALGGAAGAIFLGQWGQAEAGEPISIAMRDALRQAQNTGDWSIYDDAKAARDELINLSIWEKIALWTPIAPLIGIPNKIRGVLAGAKVLDAIAENERIQQETGESNDDKWERIREQERVDDKAAVDYYNEERKKMVEWEREAEKAARDADAAFWRAEKEKQAAMEAEDRKAIADFWLAYRKESLKIAADNRPSNLNFGLL